MNKLEDKWDEIEARLDELKAASRINNFLNKKEDKKECCKTKKIVGIIFIIAVAAAVAYGIYRYLTPDYLEDFDDDFEDDFDDDFFDDSDEE